MDASFEFLRQKLNNYSPLSDKTWQAFKKCCQLRPVSKGEVLYPIGEVPSSYCFVVSGLFRSYILDEQGNEFNKTFFNEGRFPGVMTALLKQTPINLAVQAIESSMIIDINFSQYRQLMFTNLDLCHFQIHYLETHWLLEKEQKEMQTLPFEAKERYLRFIDEHANIVARLPQYHIASYLGITPTQLSRIKKEL
ncbi:Crp/Fnr family transcriptional regulator [Colwellia sp. MB02u-10]|jgi:CRP-like cAMP-binding protein|uniref:Crp/Fnr family transcriptional regulator n=1 Tax=Colwellia sp. MB02u-10 TaxID=2759828 RepID=UPI0015F3D3B4|nr:Crp/Fnr family transcriptional regulator [Colwellia sp. MB02u-10]MBA6341148.1 Crp/Fnr family transcriptional regulator [Colwellia sp. MB02u-10]